MWPSSVSTLRAAEMGAFFQAEGVAVVQVNEFVIAPGAMAAFDQRGAVEGAHAGEGQVEERGAFVQAEGPAVFDCFEYGGGPSMMVIFFVHLSKLQLAGMIP